MLSDHRFWLGVVVGAGVFYLFHRVKGVPTNAGG